jgi:hypothetical protein
MVLNVTFSLPMVQLVEFHQEKLVQNMLKNGKIVSIWNRQGAAMFSPPITAHNKKNMVAASLQWCKMVSSTNKLVHYIIKRSNMLASPCLLVGTAPIYSAAESGNGNMFFPEWWPN